MASRELLTADCRSEPGAAPSGVIMIQAKPPLHAPPARVAKSVDAGDSKPPAARRAGSSPAPGTTAKGPTRLRAAACASAMARPIPHAFMPPLPPVTKTLLLICVAIYFAGALLPAVLG